MVRVRITVAMVLTAFSSSAMAQTPQPFPRPGEPRPGESRPAQAPPAPKQPTPAAPTPAQPATGNTQPASTAPADPKASPTQAQLGLPIYPAAQFLSSFDAGRGQRYFIFGTTASYGEIVTYYKTYLEKGGEQVFREPPTHMFEVGRFREDSMAFPPGVTVKDWTWGGSSGYPNPKLGAQPARFPTIIMIVPALPTASTGR